MKKNEFQLSNFYVNIALLYLILLATYIAYFQNFEQYNIHGRLRILPKIPVKIYAFMETYWFTFMFITFVLFGFTTFILNCIKFKDTKKIKILLPFAFSIFFILICMVPTDSIIPKTVDGGDLTNLLIAFFILTYSMTTINISSLKIHLFLENKVNKLNFKPKLIFSFSLVFGLTCITYFNTYFRNAYMTAYTEEIGGSEDYGYNGFSPFILPTLIFLLLLTFNLKKINNSYLNLLSVFLIFVQLYITVVYLLFFKHYI